MRHVDHDAEPVHLGDDPLAELADPAVLRVLVAELRSGLSGVCDVVMPAVGERDVAGAQIVVLLE